MIQLIGPESRGGFQALLQEMHQLRYRVFKERLDWRVEGSGQSESDQFDTPDAIYLLQRSSGDCLQGCVRLLPSTGPTMLRDVFPELLGGRPEPHDTAIWESSRFAIDLAAPGHGAVGGLAQPTLELFAGMIEFGLSKSLIDIVTVTDMRVERILRRAGWPLRRISDPTAASPQSAVAGYLEISREALASVRRIGQLTEPVLWAPVLGAEP